MRVDAHLKRPSGAGFLAWLIAAFFCFAVPARADQEALDLLLRLRDVLRVQYQAIQTSAARVKTDGTGAIALKSQVESFEKRYQSVEKLFPKATVKMPEQLELMNGIRLEIGRYRTSVRTLAREAGVVVSTPETPAPIAGGGEDAQYRDLKTKLARFLQETRDQSAGGPAPVGAGPGITIVGERARRPVSRTSPAPALRPAEIPEEPDADDALERLRAKAKAGHALKKQPNLEEQLAALTTNMKRAMTSPSEDDEDDQEFASARPPLKAKKPARSSVAQENLEVLHKLFAEKEETTPAPPKQTAEEMAGLLKARRLADRALDRGPTEAELMRAFEQAHEKPTADAPLIARLKSVSADLEDDNVRTKERDRAMLARQLSAEQPVRHPAPRVQSVGIGAEAARRVAKLSGAKDPGPAIDPVRERRARAEAALERVAASTPEPTQRARTRQRLARLMDPESEEPPAAAPAPAADRLAKLRALVARERGAPQPPPAARTAPPAVPPVAPVAARTAVKAPRELPPELSDEDADDPEPTHAVVAAASPGVRAAPAVRLAAGANGRLALIPPDPRRMAPPVRPAPVAARPAVAAVVAPARPAPAAPRPVLAALPVELRDEPAASGWRGDPGPPDGVRKAAAIAAPVVLAPRDPDVAAKPAVAPAKRWVWDEQSGGGGQVRMQPVPMPGKAAALRPVVAAPTTARVAVAPPPPFVPPPGRGLTPVAMPGATAPIDGQLEELRTLAAGPKPARALAPALLARAANEDRLANDVGSDADPVEARARPASLSALRDRMAARRAARQPVPAPVRVLAARAPVRVLPAAPVMPVRSKAAPATPRTFSERDFLDEAPVARVAAPVAKTAVNGHWRSRPDELPQFAEKAPPAKSPNLMVGPVNKSPYAPMLAPQPKLMYAFRPEAPAASKGVNLSELERITGPALGASVVGAETAPPPTQLAQATPAAGPVPAFSVASEDDIPSAALGSTGAEATVKTYRYEAERVYNIIRDLAEEGQINIIIKGQAPPTTMDLDVRNRSAKQVLLFVLDVNNIEYELSKSEDTLVVYGTNTARSVSKTYKFSDTVRLSLDELADVIRNSVLNAPDENAGAGAAPAAGGTDPGSGAPPGGGGAPSPPPDSGGPPPARPPAPPASEASPAPKGQ